ncbi:MAG: tRNA lysidine(34) synthetase TilS [Verrucomicrobiales bacterium]
MPEKPQLDESFATALREWLPREERCLIAVSGGRDSMALLHFLHRYGYENLVACHVNHRLRGEASDADEAFVGSEVEKFGYEIECVQVDVRGFAKRKKLSLEAAAREVRYGHFSKAAAKHDCGRVLLAHHADDQVETVLINLFRGSGRRGIGGMRARSARTIDGKKLEILRPLLSVWRAEIVAYAEEHEVPFREDESNREAFALRNRVRHRLVPVINEVFERDVRAAVLRHAALARRDEDWANAMADALPRKGKGLGVEALREMETAMRDRLLLGWLRENGVPNGGYAEVARVVDVLLSTGRPAKASLPGGIHVRRREGILFLESPDAEEDRRA